MPNPNTLKIILIAIAISTTVLRIVAFKNPNRRGSTAVATLVLFAILATIIKLFV